MYSLSKLITAVLVGVGIEDTKAIANEANFTFIVTTEPQTNKATGLQMHPLSTLHLSEKLMGEKLCVRHNEAGSEYLTECYLGVNDAISGPYLCSYLENLVEFFIDIIFPDYRNGFPPVVKINYATKTKRFDIEVTVDEYPSKKESLIYDRFSLILGGNFKFRLDEITHLRRTFVFTFYGKQFKL